MKSLPSCKYGNPLGWSYVKGNLLPEVLLTAKQYLLIIIDILKHSHFMNQ